MLRIIWAHLFSLDDSRCFTAPKCQGFLESLPLLDADHTEPPTLLPPVSEHGAGQDRVELGVHGHRVGTRLMNK